MKYVKKGSYNAFYDIRDDFGHFDPNLVQYWPKLTVFDLLHTKYQHFMKDSYSRL